MGISKKELLKRIEALEHNYVADCDYYTHCATCGCTIAKSKAYKAPGVIKERANGSYSLENYIHYDYYCLAHIPKPKRNRKPKVTLKPKESQNA